MKQSKLNAAHKRSILASLSFGLIVALRIAATALRRQRSARHDAKVTASELRRAGIALEAYNALPRHSNLATGHVMEPMNYLLVGAGESIEQAFGRAGWYTADPVSPISLIKALVALILNAPYHRGPFTPLFVGKQAQDFSFQKPTDLDTFRQRHHTRIWSTDLLDAKGQSIWIAQASYDVAIKRMAIPPAHEIAADIDAEREFVVAELVGAGAKLRDYIQLQSPHQGVNAFGDQFQTDGRAAVIEPKRTS